MKFQVTFSNSILIQMKLLILLWSKVKMIIFTLLTGLQVFILNSFRPSEMLTGIRLKGFFDKGGQL